MATESKQDFQLLFWGMTGEFSYLVLEKLLEAGINLCGLVLPATIITPQMEPIVRLELDAARSELPISQPYIQRSISHLAAQAQAPVFELRRPSAPQVAKLLAALQADVAVVACFPWRIPEHLLEVPQHGFLNLHPSLLPHLRGPFPLFWTFRLGHDRTGVTVHQMDSQLDTGPIAMQQELPLPDGISGPQVDQLLALRGAALLLNAVQLLAADQLPRIPQPRGGSRYSRPSIEDFQVPTSWPARRAYNFMRGTAEWNYPFHLIGPTVDRYLREALSFDANASQDKPLIQDGRDCWIQFTPGVLHGR